MDIHNFISNSVERKKGNFHQNCFEWYIKNSTKNRKFDQEEFFFLFFMGTFFSSKSML